MADGTRYIGAIDLGTSSSKFTVFDHSGAVIATASSELATATPRTDWAEQDPVQMWTSTVDAIEAVLTDVDPAHIEALGITNQRETTIVWDRETGEPVYDAILWQDQRTRDRIQELEERGLREFIEERTGLEPDPYLSAGKLEWVLDEQDLRERAQAGEVLFGTVDSWLLYNLTGVHATDVSNASRTMLFDIRELTWSERLLEEFDVPPAMLPAVSPSSHADAFGTTDSNGVLGQEIPVTGILGDQQSALFGHAGFQEGDLKHTIGTTSVMTTNVGTDPGQKVDGLNLTIGYQLAGETPVYAVEGLTWSGGQALDWLSKIGVIEIPEETEALAFAAESTDGVYFVPALNGLGSPYWRADATGTLVGVTPATGREQLVRAALEAIAFRATDVTRTMTANVGQTLERIAVDGGMAANGFLCQRLSDFTGLVVERPTVREATSLGVAYMAGLGVGYWDSVDELETHRRIDAEFEPQISREAARTLYEGWCDAVRKSYD